MTRAMERERQKQNAVLVPVIRKLAETGLYIHEIAKALNCTPRRICGMLGHHDIAVRSAPKSLTDAWHRNKAERAMMAKLIDPPPDPEKLFAKAIGAEEYGDDDRAAPPMSFQSPRRPPAALTANSSMAWAG